MWEDILEALAVGGSGAISGYQEAKELEAARAERERERQEAQAFRDAQLAMQRERLEMERAAGEAREARATEQDLASGMLREAREIPNLAAARSTISEALEAGERADEGLFGVTPAPGQTYAPQAMRNYRAMAEAAGRPSTREPTEAMMAGDISPLAKSLMEETAGEGREVQRPGAEGAFLSDLLAEVPEFTPSDTFQERGSREFEGRILRPTTPAERAATEAEFQREASAQALEDERAALKAQEDFLKERFPDLTEAQIAETVYGVQPMAMPEDDTPSKIREMDALARRFPDATPEELAAMVGYKLPGEGGVEGLDPGVVNTLRNSFNREIEEANQVASAYGRVISSGQSALERESPAAQISLVFSYMKMVDPPSVVREGEYATARNATGVSDRVRNIYNSLLRGEFLNPNQIRDFMNQAESYLDVTQRMYQPTIERARVLSNAVGVNPDLVVYDPIEAARSSVGRSQTSGVGSILDDVYDEPAPIGPTIQGFEQTNRQFNNDFFLNGGIGG